MKNRNFFALIAAWLVAGPATYAQTASAPAKDETVTLSPFEVRTDRDTGFVAASSLAGGRLASDLKDTPVAYSVLTREFIDALGRILVARGGIRTAGDAFFDLRADYPARVNLAKPDQAGEAAGAFLSDGFYLFPKEPTPVWKNYEEGTLSRLAFDNLSINVKLAYPDGTSQVQRFWPECYSTTSIASGVPVPVVFAKPGGLK